LIDPWLSGPAIIGASWFASSEHTTAPCLQDLSEMDEPDLVIVSQNKTDHCHEATLRQLLPNTRSRIVAEPGAAKAIRAYNHFEPSRIIKMRKYCQKDPTSILRFPVDPPSPSGHGGEVTIAFIPARNYYLTGLHNAIGITYQAPTGLLTGGSSITPPAKALLRERAPDEASLPSTPKNSLATNPLAAVSWLHRSASVRNDTVDLPTTQSWTSASGLNYASQSPSDVPATCPGSPMSTSTFDSVFDPSFRDMVVSPATTIPPLSPPAPTYATHTGRVFSFSPSSTTFPVKPRPLSIIYSPHGVPLQQELQSYVAKYLRPLAAIPLTLLLHSFHRVDNPWYFGGNICTGAGGGMKLAHAMRARCWVSAHDEDKDDRGLATRLVRKERIDAGEIMQALATRKGDGGGHWKVSIRRLAVGEQLVLLPSGVDQAFESYHFG
jgi:hypothetical protein